MNQHHTFKTISVEVIESCINAIESSIDHFTAAKRNMQELVDFLQEENAGEGKAIASRNQPKNNEPLCLSKANYIAVLSLEQLGLESPTQKQIDVMESVILLAMDSDRLNKENISICLGEDNVAKRILFRMLRETKS